MKCIQVLSYLCKQFVLLRIRVSGHQTSDAVLSKAVVLLLLFNKVFIAAPIVFVGVCVPLVHMQYFVSFCVLQSSCWRRRAGCLLLLSS